MERYADTVLSVMVAPWQCLRLSLDSVVNDEPKVEDRVLKLNTWLTSKKYEAGSVSVSVSVLIVLERIEVLIQSQ